MRAQRYRWAMRSYPPHYRRSHGAEIVDTARALDGGHWSLRQATSLVAGGFLTRGRLASAEGAAAVWRAGLGLALWWWLASAAASLIAWRFGIHPDDTNLDVASRSTQVFVALVSALLALSLSTRWPTATVVTTLSVSLGVSDAGPGAGQRVVVITAAAAVVAGWWLAVRGSGRPVVRPAGSIISVAVLVASAALVGDPARAIGFWSIALALIGLVALPADGRIAAALVWSLAFGAIRSPTVVLAGASAVPLAVIAPIVYLTIRHTTGRNTAPHPRHSM